MADPALIMNRYGDAIKLRTKPKNKERKSVRMRDLFSIGPKMQLFELSWYISRMESGKFCQKRCKGGVVRDKLEKFPRKLAFFHI